MNRRFDFQIFCRPATRTWRHRARCRRYRQNVWQRSICLKHKRHGTAHEHWTVWSQSGVWSVSVCCKVSNFFMRRYFYMRRSPNIEWFFHHTTTTPLVFCPEIFKLKVNMLPLKFWGSNWAAQLLPLKICHNNALFVHWFWYIHGIFYNLIESKQEVVLYCFA